MKIRPRFNIRAILIVTLLTGLLITGLSRIPTDATILVPWQYGDAMDNALTRHGVPAMRATAGNFNCQYFYSVEGQAYKIWLAQNALFEDAKENGYYCQIAYTPVLPIRTVRASVGDDRMVGLQ